MRKMIKACALLLASLVIVLGVEVAWDAAQGSAMLSTALGEAETAADACGIEAVPGWFKDEVLPLDRCAEVQVWQGSGTIVGFTQVGTLSEVSSSIALSMAERGWTMVESGSQALMTFSKDVGLCRWAAVSCSEVGDQLAVVVQCARGGG